MFSVMSLIMWMAVTLMVNYDDGDDGSDGDVDADADGDDDDDGGEEYDCDDDGDNLARGIGSIGAAQNS